MKSSNCTHMYTKILHQTFAIIVGTWETTIHSSCFPVEGLQHRSSISTMGNTIHAVVTCGEGGGWPHRIPSGASEDQRSSLLSQYLLFLDIPSISFSTSFLSSSLIFEFMLSGRSHIYSPEFVRKQFHGGEPLLYRRRFVSSSLY